jgi:hypothetical protein
VPQPLRHESAPAPSPAGSEERIRLLYLGALGRSGTTLLERVLGQLPDSCSVGEIVHLWQRGVLDDEKCGCGLPFSACSFWTAVGRRAFGGWDRALGERMTQLQPLVDRTRFVPQLLAPSRPGLPHADLAEYVDTYVRLYEAIREVSGRPVVIDSSKHSSLAFCLRTDPRLDLRVVHVVRDSRGVAYSWTKEVRRPESAAADALMPRFSPGRSAALWNGHNACFALLGRLGTPTTRLRYEDFVAFPDRTLRQLAGFAGLPVPDGSWDFLTDRTVELGVSHTVAGNPMRFRTGPITIRRDDEWRLRLPSGSRILTSALTFPLLARYGYLGSPSRSAG